MSDSQKRLDPKELEQAETLFVRDIENRVFQSIVLQCLSKIKGITLVEGNFIDHLLGRSSREKPIKGIFAEQDASSQAVTIKIEVNICYGVPIPQKAEEIQMLVSKVVTDLTGLHVGCVHVVFKNVVMEEAPPAPTPTWSEEEGKKKDSLTPIFEEN